MTKKQKENIAKIFINLGSIIFGGVVLRYFVPSEGISESELIVGSIVVFLCFAMAISVDQ